jgi:hypothetical protein
MRWLCILLCAGCFTKDRKPMVADTHQGGTIMLPAPCNYSVTTQDSASRPEIPEVLMLGSDPTPKMIHLNVAHDPMTGMAILWRTNDNSTLATTVQYGVNGKTDQSTDGFTFVYDISIGDPVRIHETHLCGLTPDTEYTYRVGGTDALGNQSWSSNYTFRTAPKAQDAETVFLVLGDTRDGYDVWGSTLKLAVQMAMPDFILFSGDETTLGPLQDEWDAWFAAADPILASNPMIVAHGNHEVNSVNFFSQFAMPGDEQNFAVDIGAAHVTVANDTPVDMADLTGANAQLLDQHLSTNQPWSILVHHKPMFSASAGAHPGDVVTMRMAWQSIIDSHKVDLVLNGHDHDYERSKPMRGSTPGLTNADGTVFAVVGSAGAPLYDNGSDFWTAFSAKTYCFAIMRVKAGLITFNAYHADGTPLDSTMLTK